MVRDHSKRIDVTLFRWIPMLRTGTGRVQQFRCHVSGGAGIRRRFSVRIQSIWIGYDGDESVVSETRMEIAVNKDICL